MKPWCTDSYAHSTNIRWFDSCPVCDNEPELPQTRKIIREKFSFKFWEWFKR